MLSNEEVKKYYFQLEDLTGEKWVSLSIIKRDLGERYKHKENYEISNLGRIKTFDYNHTGETKILKYTTKKTGYCYIFKGIGLHILVAEAFIENKNNYDNVHHINGDKTDNRVCNLEWKPVSKHVRDHRKGKKVGCYTLDGKLIKIYDCSIDVRKDGFKQSHVWNCCNGKEEKYRDYIWKYL